MSEVANTTKEVIEVVTTALQPLADKLGTTAQYVWGLQVKQAYVEGFIALGGLVFGIFLWVLSVVIARGLAKDRSCDLDDVALITFSIFALFGSIFVYINFSTVLNCFVNPEYYALQQLIKLVK